MIAFLTEYGGVFGTAAVVTGWVTHVDPFGGLHWDLHDVLTGLKLFLPLMVFDALVMLPDYHIRPDISTSAAKVSVGDMTGNGLIEHNLRRRAERLRKKAAITGTAPPGDHSTTPAAPASSTTQPVSDDLTSGRLTTSTPQSAPHDHSSPVKFRPSFMVEDDDGNAAAGTNSFSKLVVRSKMTLEMLQQYNARDHPGRALSPTAEVLVIAVSALAEEMLWRAVGLTLLGLWLRDRLFEAGFDDDMLVNGSSMATSDVAKYMSVGIGAAVGAALFAVNYWREQEMLKAIQVRPRDDKASEASEAIKQQLLATFGATTAGVAVLDGLRTVAAGVIAGTSFIITGNLAAPYAGGMATEVRCYWLVGPSKYLPALSAAVQPALLKTQLAV
eukprot:jgi/Chrzof1/15238/Cz09g32170.t1